MKIYAAQRLLRASPSITLEKWKSAVLKMYPRVKFIREDGSGKTYGERGDWSAVNGPDLQADIIGIYAPSSFSAWIMKGDDFDEYRVTAGVSPVSDGSAFTLVDGGPPTNKQPQVQQLTDNDGSFEEDEDQALLRDDLPI